MNNMLQKVADAIKAANDDLYAILKYNIRDSSWEIWIDNKTAEVNFKDYNKAEDRCEDLNYLYAARKAVEALKEAEFNAKFLDIVLHGVSYSMTFENGVKIPIKAEDIFK
jgi:hypothetical protein